VAQQFATLQVVTCFLQFCCATNVAVNMHMSYAMQRNAEDLSNTMS
jgi:hypothetical protein